MSPDKNSLDGLRINREVPQKSRLGFAWIAGFAVLALLLLGLGWRWWQSQKAIVRTVVAREATGGGSRTVLNASGYVTARRQATVSSKVTGKVVEVMVEEGKTVKAGQVLARLDAANVEANLHWVEAQAKASHAALGETQVRLAEAEKDLKRITDLKNNNIATVAELDKASAEVESLKARLTRQTAEATVGDSQVELWKQQLDDTIIRAPFSGVVVTKNAQPGEMISPMSAGGAFTRTGICTIVDMESLEIEIDVNEAFIQRVEPGGTVTAKLDAYPDWPIPAKVIAIIPTADRQKATVKVRVGFDKLDPRILPDMGVKVAFQGSAPSAFETPGIVLPKAAVRKQDGREVVWVVQNGKLERRAINSRNTTGDEVTITSGLSAGEKVVISGPEMLAEGNLVLEEKP